MHLGPLTTSYSIIVDMSCEQLDYKVIFPLRLFSWKDFKETTKKQNLQKCFKKKSYK